MSVLDILRGHRAGGLGAMSIPLPCPYCDHADDSAAAHMLHLEEHGIRREDLIRLTWRDSNGPIQRRFFSDMSEYFAFMQKHFGGKTWPRYVVAGRDGVIDWYPRVYESTRGMTKAEAEAEALDAAPVGEEAVP